MNQWRLKAKSEMRSKGITQEQMAEHLEVSQGGLSHWLNGRREADIDVIERIAKKLGLTLAELVQDDDSIPNMPPNTEYQPVIAWDTPEDLPPDQFVIIPRYDIVLSGGNGVVNYVVNKKAQGMAFMRSWIQQKRLNPKNLISVVLEGKSMEPTLPDGSVVLIDRSKTEVEPGRKVYALRYGDELRIKRLSRRFDGALVIESDNPGPGFEKEIIQGDDLNHIQILGKYVSHSFDGEI